jgi:hypothetical protein
MMNSYEIKNQRVLDILDRYIQFVMDYDMSQTTDLISNDSAEKWISTEYRDKIIAMGKDHFGSPESAKSYPMKPDNHKNLPIEYRQKFMELSDELRLELAFESNALSQKYPPNGYIGWHNNANARGYNLIFTWSETGDGWFKYINEDGEEITIPDKKGWSLKAGYFAGYDEDVPTCYHTAYTNCWRVTQSFVVSDNKEFWKDCIEYITNP